MTGAYVEKYNLN